jgi:hypothetical protein
MKVSADELLHCVQFLNIQSHFHNTSELIQRCFLLLSGNVPTTLLLLLVISLELEHHLTDPVMGPASLLLPGWGIKTNAWKRNLSPKFNASEPK